MAQLQMGGMVLGVLAISLLLRRWLLGRLAKAAGGDAESFFAVIGEDLKTPTLLWCLALSVEVLLDIVEMPARASRIGHHVVHAFFIISMTMVASSILIHLMQKYGDKLGVPFAVAGLSKTLTRVFVFSIGILILLRSMGISITPVLTALGVGGLAVALALQDTLANIFAGIHILIERPIRVGDYIRLSADEEGTVADIGWRTTRIETLANTTVVVPNKTITSVNLLNYAMPSVEVTVWIPVMIGHNADVAKAEQIAIAAALSVEDVLHDPAPALIPDPGMQPTHLQFRLVMRIPAQTRSGGIRMRVLKTMLDGFRKADIPLPEVPPRY